MAAAVATRRLPGIAFETQPPASPRILPRMDVAAFVGFAAAGPVHVPVAVEDADGFAAVFGEDAPLAWDEQQGGPATAQLAPSVRSFFRNGGRRAWIVRVAAGAQRSTLPVPGVVERSEGGELRQAQLEARAAGSWADALQVGGALQSAPALLRAASPARLAFYVEAGATAIAPGDLLRIADERFTLLVVARQVRRSRALPRGIDAPPPGRTLLTVLGDRATALWLERIEPPYELRGFARYTDPSGREQRVPARLPAPESSPPATDDTIALELEAPAADAPARGTLVEWPVGSPPLPATLWLPVAEVGEAAPGRVRARGVPAWARHAAPDPLPTFAPGTATVERLELELTVLHGDRRIVLSGLGFSPQHPRYLGDLPSDEALFTPRDPLLSPAPALWSSAADPRFPLACRDAGRRVFAPLGIRTLPDAFAGPLAAAGAKLDRDGLATFDDALFLDDALRGSGPDALCATADFVRWQSERPRALTGIHALLDLEEVTIVSVPDAGQRGWAPASPAYVPPAPPTNVPESPPSPPVAPEPFVDCALHALEAPELELVPRDQGGGFGLKWNAVDEPSVRYVLQESTDPLGWGHARTIQTGPRREIRLFGRTTGTFFYRVRAEAGPNVSPWSNGVAVGTPPGPGYALVPETAYDGATLLAVQRALLRMCAARGDLLAVLSLPRHFRVDAATAHVARLRAAADPRRAGPPPPAGRDPVLPLDGAEQRALGFGALYHPWLALSVPGRAESFGTAPPDGAVVGVMAHRAATRGAWVAPANEPFEDAIALVDGSPRAALVALQEAQVNELRQEPGGFVCLCADTLHPEDDLRPITVRRLLSLVRRLALREGAQYVFEPNDPVFRRDIERGFGQVMQTLHMLGAFSGRTPEQGYRVNVGDPPNTAASIDQGRLIVELKVAPSRPLAFLLVRLIHGAERGLEIEAP